jgi:anti-sigma factor RsiW
MSCERWSAMLRSYADESYREEGYSEEDQAALQDHLQDCLACGREALRRVEEKRAIRRAVTRFEPAPEFRAQIQEMIREEKVREKLTLEEMSRKESEAKRDGKRAWLPKWAWATGLASGLALAALVVVIFSSALWQRNGNENQAVAELLDMHVATMASANPVDVISTDRHTVKPWFQGKLPFTFNLPELQDSPFRLIGGKVVYLHGNPGAQLLFEVRKHELSVFLFEDKPGVRSPEAGATSEKGFHVESWSQAGLRYVVMSDTSESDVHALSELLRAAGKS